MVTKSDLHFRNSLHDKVTLGFDTVDDFEIYKKNLLSIINEFQVDYRAKQTSFWIVSKILECIQKPDKSIKEYVAQAMVMLK